jgi:hypothetical protein
MRIFNGIDCRHKHLGEGNILIEYKLRDFCGPINKVLLSIRIYHMVKYTLTSREGEIDKGIFNH